MSSLTMCRGKELDDSRQCDLRSACYRSTAEPARLGQRYYDKLPMVVEEGRTACAEHLVLVPL